MDDRRRNPRVTVWSPLTLQGPEGSVPATLRNLSLAGVSCITEQPFEEMTKMQVDLELPSVVDGKTSRNTVSIEAAVVRCEATPTSGPRRKYDVALFFPDLSDANREALENFLESRAVPMS